jgi:hypothetical protein
MRMPPRATSNLAELTTLRTGRPGRFLALGLLALAGAVVFCHGVSQER